MCGGLVLPTMNRRAKDHAADLRPVDRGVLKGGDIVGGTVEAMATQDRRKPFRDPARLLGKLATAS